MKYEPLNLGKLQQLVDSGRIDAAQPINMYALHQAGAVGRVEHGIKLLADVRGMLHGFIDAMQYLLVTQLHIFSAQLLCICEVFSSTYTCGRGQNGLVLN